MNSIKEISSDKERYMELLLIGDEQEDMVLRYLERGRLFVMEKAGEACAVCVVTDEGNGDLEIKNIAVLPKYQRQGIGKEFISYIQKRFSGEYRRLILGTGDSPLTVPFYEKCGFRRCGVIKNFFIDNYDHPIIEVGVRLCDMICFEKELNGYYGTDREGFAETR
jgi:ribosomal protein S18 acetylase RimI-like enzyme